jgi:hypothetical protein
VAVLERSIRCCENQSTAAAHDMSKPSTQASEVTAAKDDQLLGLARLLVTGDGQVDNR